MKEREGNILEGIAMQLGAAFERSESPVLTLTQPLTVTMKTRMGKYIREPLIGSEEFVATTAYMGKRGKIIVVFQPKDIHIASKYALMEMDVETARVTMMGFSAYMDSMLTDLDFDEELRRLKDEAGRGAREEKFRRATGHYAESFGSW